MFVPEHVRAFPQPTLHRPGAIFYLRWDRRRPGLKMRQRHVRRRDRLIGERLDQVVEFFAGRHGGIIMSAMVLFDANRSPRPLRLIAAFRGRFLPDTDLIEHI